MGQIDKIKFEITKESDEAPRIYRLYDDQLHFYESLKNLKIRL